MKLPKDIDYGDLLRPFVKKMRYPCLKCGFMTTNIELNDGKKVALCFGCKFK